MSIAINWKSVIASSSVMVRHAKATQSLEEIATRFYADACDPWEFTCKGCGTITDEAHLHSDWKTATCSNCYSERMCISKVRLTFHNWGEQNGGDAELLGRYNAAMEMEEQR